MRRILLIGLAAAIVAAGCARPAMQAGTETGIHLENAWARRAPAMGPDMSGGHGTMGHGSAGNGAVYVTIVNHGAGPDALVRAATDAAKIVELHEVVQEGGVMKMRPLPRIEVPASGRLEMKPGGHHIMLLGLTRDLKPGDVVSVTLTFDKGGRMTVDAPVR
jgi:copper(I)-binding protein